jgi:hypothetical protein
VALDHLMFNDKDLNPPVASRENDTVELSQLLIRFHEPTFRVRSGTMDGRFGPIHGDH